MFSPYHKLNNCQRLEKWFESHVDAGTVPSDIVNGHYRYHYALIHKLKSAMVHLDNLSDVLTNTDASSVLPNSEEFLLKVNMSLDSFFYCCGSALDILAREVIVYFNIPITGYVYFQTAHRAIRAVRPSDPILEKLENPTWKDEFTNYRNALTHEVLIAGNFLIQFNVTGRTSQKTIVFPLPDDPRVDISDRTFRRNQDAYKYCSTTFIRLLSLINQIYGEIEQRARSTNSMPL